ncbi:hypothetical protein niasHS_002217 [Heterodera schachtii]|uniref:C3H1-type domain-containing protein n=1 Tax=Heterodera schachtii TaxID=97005 RepID=A0ABD2KML7_HETSC
MFNNHANHFMPNFCIPPPPPPQLPQPLNSARVFFPPVSHHHPPAYYLQPQHAHPHMNPQFFNLSVPPPPITQNISSLIAANINNYPTRHPLNCTHQITTSERFSKTFHTGHANGFTSKGNGAPLNRSRKRFLEQITNEEGTSGELRIELDTAPRNRPLSGQSSTEVDQEAADESPNSKESGCSENSQESLRLVPTDNDSDGEHPEMGRNWRILMLFNGLVRDEDLAPNCERPQAEHGRTYPDIQKKMFTQNGEEQKEQHEQHKLLKLMSLKLPLDTNHEVGPASSSTGYGMRTSNVWVSSDLMAKMIQQQQTVSFTTKSSAASDHSIPPPPIVHDKNNLQLNTRETVDARHPGTRKRLHHNRSLIILKTGRRVYQGSKDCFQFLETGNCLNGVFCEYEHEGSTEHSAKKVCPFLMRGQCRNIDDNCPHGPHSTLKAHQMPVCDYYLRICCSKGKDQCAYLHVKHTDGMEPCEEFNRGCCQQGVMCDAPHRYRYHRIKEKQTEYPKQSAKQQTPGTELLDNSHSVSTDKQNDTLKWFS